MCFIIGTLRKSSWSGSPEGPS